MSLRIDKSWVVVDSIENFEANRCVDLFRRPDGTFGFEEFRRDVEDGGTWTPTAYFSVRMFDSDSEALVAAKTVVPWLADRLST